jgi:hypothetical protein
MENGNIFRVARTREELEQAYSLVYREYLKRGYMLEDPCGLRFSIYNTLSQTTTLVAYTPTGELISTATIIPDSPLGLPMDQTYHAELNQLRKQNKKICEISMLASDSDYFKHGSLSVPLKKLGVILSFFKILLDYVVLVLGHDYMCIAINPKYAMVFDMILFQDLGGLKSYPEANGAPAIAKYLDVHGVAAGFSRPGKEKLYEIFVLRKTAPESFLNKKILAPDDLQYFAERTGKPAGMFAVSLDKSGF